MMPQLQSLLLAPPLESDANIFMFYYILRVFGS